VSIVFCWGTRPEAIKIGPVVAELRALGIKPKLISTGQHWDLLRGTPAETDLADSESLGLPANGDPWAWVDEAVHALELWLHSTEPPLSKSTLFVVQGDTASALAGAQFAYRWGFRLAHIEAGVRSGAFGEPYPEEHFRHQITHLADWHYAATERCVDNVLRDGISRDHIVLTGNPVVSALARYTDVKLRAPKNHIVLTMHRREWLERVDLSTFLNHVENWCHANPDFAVVWPVHPAVQKRWPQSWKRSVNLFITGPMGYLGMMTELSSAHGLATDSGGLVEEATTLGIPTAILRNANDRPEAIASGLAQQFAPTAPDIALDWLTKDHPRIPSTIFGSPDSAAKIAKHLAALIAKSVRITGKTPSHHPVRDF